ncbi:uncharacterized protein [Periplaneta americana]|uniref:uncharacterized protein n=1 Tax=Periplaneta americana TaxID=6978 RepID=UPI0037E97C6A
MLHDACGRHVVPLLLVLAAIVASLLVSSTAARTTTVEPEKEARQETAASSSKDSRGLFSPRMEYDEWTPLGRGDPLKNDPTYDYVPPVLERVHYWIEPSSRTPDPPIPTLGHASKEPEISRLSQKRPTEETHKDSENSSADSRRDIYDPFFLKFVDGPKFSSTQHRNHQHYYHHHYGRRPSSTVSQQSNSPSSIQRTHHYLPSFPPYHSYQHKNQQKQRPYENHALSDRQHTKYNQRTTIESSNSSSVSQSERLRPTMEAPMFQTELHHHHNEQEQQPRPPYTMLVPPPLQIPNSFTSMSDTLKPNQVAEQIKMTTQPPVSLEQANLVYQQTSTTPTLDWKEGKTQLATIAAASSQVTWKAPLPTKHDKYHYQAPYSATTIHSYRNPSLLYSPNVEVLPSTELQFSDNNNINYPAANNKTQPQQWSTNMMVTTMPPSTLAMTTASSLTTDPLFSHYKQPAEPLRGPMYLIIQGHSKVKTYGANKHQNSYHGIPIQESNDINQRSNGENSNDRVGKALEGYLPLESDEQLNGDTSVINSAETEATFLDQDSLIQGDIGLSSSAAEGNDEVELNYVTETESISSYTEKDERPTRKKRELNSKDIISFNDDVGKEDVSYILAEQKSQGSGTHVLISSLSRLKRALPTSVP